MVYMHRTIYIMFLLALGHTLLSQQKPKYSEIGVTAGNLVYTGPFASDANMGNWLNEMGWRFGVFTRKSLAPWITVGLEANYGWYTLDDANHGRAQRGITMTTQVLNANVSTELILIRYGKFHWNNNFAPYVKLGAGGVFYSPDIKNFGSVDSDVQVFPFSGQSINYFFGIGVKFRLAYKHSLALEWVTHNAGTREMGGVVAPAVNPSNDMYGGILLHYSVLIF